jgi:cytochrome P450
MVFHICKYGLACCILQSFMKLIIGEKLDLEDPALIKIVDSLNYLVRNANPLSPLTAALPHPAMAKLPILSKLTGYDLLIDTFKPLVQLMQPYVEDHRRTIDPDHVRDFLDLMLLEQQKADPSSCFNGKLGSVMIINAMIDMFFAGNETTASSLLNLFLQLLHHPEVQEKVQLEIEQVLKTLTV